MSENKTILTTRRFELWWRKAQAWFATQFASINVDLTPVEEKVDEVKSDVADVKTAVENIDIDTLAKQGTDQTATLTAILAAVLIVGTYRQLSKKAESKHQ